MGRPICMPGFGGGRCLAACHGGEDVYFGAIGDCLVEPEGFLAVDGEEEVGADAGAIDELAGESGVALREVGDDLAQGCPAGLDLRGAAGEGPERRGEEDGDHGYAFIASVVSRMRRGDIGSWCWRTPVAR